MFMKMIAAALLALGAENIFFSGGNGFSRALRSARRPGLIGVYAGFITFFSLISALSGILLIPLLPNLGMPEYTFPAYAALFAAAAYSLSAALLHGLMPALYQKCAPVLAPSALNTAVLAVLFLGRNMEPVQAVGFVIGTGAAFLFASLALSHALELGKNPEMPKAFSGLPAALIYIGILSMAFAGFTGARM